MQNPKSSCAHHPTLRFPGVGLGVKGQKPKWLRDEEAWAGLVLPSTRPGSQGCVQCGPYCLSGRQTPRRGTPAGNGSTMPGVGGSWEPEHRERGRRRHKGSTRDQKVVGGPKAAESDRGSGRGEGASPRSRSAVNPANGLQNDADPRERRSTQI